MAAMCQVYVKLVRAVVPPDEWPQYTTMALSYAQRSYERRSRIAEYYGRTPPEAKKILSRLYVGGKQHLGGANDLSRSADILPCVAELAHQIAKGCERLSTTHPEFISIISHPRFVSQPRPYLSAFAILLQTELFRTTSALGVIGRQENAHVMTYVHDSIYICADTFPTLAATYERIRARMWGEHSVLVALRDASGERIGPADQTESPSLRTGQSNQPAQTAARPAAPPAPPSIPSASIPEEHRGRAEDPRDVPTGGQSWSVPDGALAKLRALHREGSQCIAWAALALFPALSEDQSFVSEMAKPGTKPHQSIADAAVRQLVMVCANDSVALTTEGVYICYRPPQRHGARHGHSVAIKVSAQGRCVYTTQPSADGSPVLRPLPPNETLRGCVFWALLPPASRRLSRAEDGPSLSLVAGSESDYGDSDHDDDPAGDNLEPLINTLREETTSWTPPPMTQGVMKPCPLCPMRVFSENGTL